MMHDSPPPSWYEPPDEAEEEVKDTLVFHIDKWLGCGLPIMANAPAWLVVCKCPPEYFEDNDD